MRKLFIISSIVLSTLTSVAQNKLLTLEDALLNNRTTLSPENLRQLQFVYNTDDYIYLKKIDDNETWMRGNFKSKNDQPFLSIAQLNQKLKSAGRDTVNSMPPIQFNQSAEWITTINDSKIGINPVTNKIRTIIDKT